MAASRKLRKGQTSNKPDSEEPDLPVVRLFLLVLFEVIRWLTGPQG